MGGCERSEPAGAEANPMTGEYFISSNDLQAAVMFLRALHDEDDEALVLAMEGVEEPLSVAAQFAHQVLALIEVVHDLGSGPSVDDALASFGLSSARVAEERGE
jgi:hypothetical protein